MTRYKPTRLRPSEGGRMRSMGPANPEDVQRAAEVEERRLANKVGPVEPPVHPVDEELERTPVKVSTFGDLSEGQTFRFFRYGQEKDTFAKVRMEHGWGRRNLRLGTVCETSAICEVEPIDEPQRTTFGELKVGQRFRFTGFDGYGVCIRDVGDLFRDEARPGWGGIMNPDEPVEVVTMADKHLGKLRFVSYADNGGTAADEHERADVWLKEVDGQLYREGLRLAGKMVRRPECWSPDDWPAVWGPIDEVTRDNLGRVHANRVGYCALAEDCEVVTDAG